MKDIITIDWVDYKRIEKEEEVIVSDAEEALPRPQVLENPDLSSLVKNIEAIIKEVEDWEYHEDNGWDHHIFEAAIDALYWDYFREWFNKNT